MSTIHKIINGDSRKVNLLDKNSVHLIITSPPYWQLKDYGSENQIGYNESYENYVNNLNLVWNECYRILHPGCRLCINIGDQFARSVYYGRYKVIPIRSEIIKFCETIGFDYMGAIIWQKVTTTNTTGGASIMGSFPYPRNGILKIDYEFILLFKKQGIAPKPTKIQKENSKLSKEEWNKYFTGHWHFSGVKQNGHLAMFPEELPSRLIKMFSFTGDIIFDPFLGSGTTSLASRNLERNSAGYEINSEYIDIIKKRLNINQGDLSGTEYVFLKDELKEDISVKINQLPYKFKDPHALDIKIDPKKMQFGSRIDNNRSEREEYFTVNEVLSPEFLRLNSGVPIKLIGIKEKHEKHESAKKFLFEKTKGEKVYLKFDQKKYDNDNNLLCYLYLKNRTFINAQMIKMGLVEVDNSLDFKYKQKFLRLQNNII